MKYNDPDNPAWHPEIIMIEALAKVELLEEKLKGTNFCVTGIAIEAVAFRHPDSRVTEAMVNTISRATGLNVDYRVSQEKKKIRYLIGPKEE